MARVLACIPTVWNYVRAECFASLANMDWGEAEVVYDYMPGWEGVSQARNDIARKALEDGYTHVLMVDSDMVLPENALANLLSHDVDVCMGYYVRGRSDDGLTCAIRKGAHNFDDSHHVGELVDLGKKGEYLVEVKGNGMGCALINVDVFRKLEEPWFAFRRNRNGSTLSEDYFFCEKCALNKVKLHVDTRVGCGHIHDRLLEAM